MQIVMVAIIPGLIETGLPMSASVLGAVGIVPPADVCTIVAYQSPQPEICE